jgi:Fur family transcriptional regulator, peroxide stress response regulator
MSRKSIQRDTILRVVMNTTTHPGADWVYDQVRKEIPKISMGTVYRNLKILAQSGEIMELDVPGSLSRFDGNNCNHYHFRCEKCGYIFDLDETVDCSIERKIAKKTGFKIKRHYLEFIGLCCSCQKDTEE